MGRFNFGKGPHDLHFPVTLTLSKQQNSRLVQVERICRRQNKYDRKIEICFWNGRTIWEKEKMLVIHIFSFSQNVKKPLSQWSLKVGNVL